MKETRSIKFFLNKDVNKTKLFQIETFLEECKLVENQLYKIFWDNEKYKYIINSKNKIDFDNFTKEFINFRDFTPRLKSHHFHQVLLDVYGNLTGIKVKIINKLRFSTDNAYDGKVLKYLKGFCFDWNKLETYNAKQLKKYKNKDEKYYNFLLEIKSIINNKEQYDKYKEIIENKFWENKNKIKCPQLKNGTVWCNTAHTIKLKQNSYFDYYFTLNTNKRIGGTEKKAAYEKIVLPIKFSKYHHDKLDGVKLNNSFKIRQRNDGRIEIMATYNIDKEYPNNNEIKDYVGIDIGLKYLIFSSDGEFIEQNPKILKELKQVSIHNANYQRLRQHLKDKYGRELSNKKFLLRNQKLADMVKCDNRYKIKQFLKGRENDLIIMEDLRIGYSNLSNKTNRLMRVLNIQRIVEDVERYCKEFGIKLVKVNPMYTSQTCPVCGCISKENRKTQSKFKCIKCGHEDNADHNASINIRERYFMKGIDYNLEPEKIKELLRLRCISH